MKIQINITKEVLERSKDCNSRNETTHCAFALAFREIFPNAIVYQMSTIPFSGSERIQHNSKMFEWIQRFDFMEPSERENIKPESFELLLPEWVIQRIGLSEIDRILSESKTLELVKI